METHIVHRAAGDFPGFPGHVVLALAGVGAGGELGGAVVETLLLLLLSVLGGGVVGAACAVEVGVAHRGGAHAWDRGGRKELLGVGVVVSRGAVSARDGALAPAAGATGGVGLCAPRISLRRRAVPLHLRVGALGRGSACLLAFGGAFRGRGGRGEVRHRHAFQRRTRVAGCGARRRERCGGARRVVSVRRLRRASAPVLRRRGVRVLGRRIVAWRAGECAIYKWK